MKLTKELKRILAPIGLSLLLAATASAGNNPTSAADLGLSGEWADHWNGCYDLNLPYFQKRIADFQSLLKAGQAWEVALEIEKREIDIVTNETCKKWAADPNGDGALREFLEKFGKVASQGVALKGTVVTQLSPQLTAWQEVEDEELKPYKFKLEEFPCGKAFEETEQHIAMQMKLLQDKFNVLEEKCPKAADEIIAQARATAFDFKAHTYGKGMGEVKFNGTAENGTSDITGTQKQKQQSAEGEEILKQQDKDAQLRNQKK